MEGVPDADIRDEDSPQVHVATRWSSRVSLLRNSERNVTKFAPYKALKLIA